MNKARAVFLVVLILSLVGMVLLLIHEKPTTPLESTLAPFYQLIGNIPKDLDQSLVALMPLDQLDEKKYGQAIALRYAGHARTDTSTKKYLDDLMATLVPFKKRDFDYKIFVVQYSAPNAFALPGGVIVVTQSLLSLVKSEGELVSILAHEMGHIELSHCMSAVKYELLTKKIGDESLGRLVDFATALLLRHSFSKTQENDADEYAYAMLENTEYDVACLGQALQRLQPFEQEQGSRSAAEQQADIFRDYIRSHSPVEIRVDKFQNLAKSWWSKHQGVKRYRGQQNLAQKISFTHKQFANEWTRDGINLTPPV